MAEHRENDPTDIASDDEGTERLEPEKRRDSDAPTEVTGAGDDADAPTEITGTGEPTDASTEITDAGDDAATEVTGGRDAPTEAAGEDAPTAVSAGATDYGRRRPSPLAAMRPGYVLKERFRLEEKLGEGGMGAVFRAVDQRKVETRHHNPHVAIKLLAGDFSRDARAFIALQRETDKSQTLAHPNIITVYDFDRDGDVFFMTMESLVGETLDKVIRSPERDRQKALRYIAELASGIAYAHRRNIVHSDLKPPNIFITEDDTLKILDFGIARAFSAIEEDRKGRADDVEIVGLTPAYASCEMFEGKDPHPADDVYAIGLIAYEMLTGEHPFGRKKAIDAREEGLKPKRIKGIPGYQWQAIARALAFDRTARWQDAEQFRRKFSGVGRRVKQLSAALLVAVISFGGYLALYEPEAGPDIPFEELPPATQQQVTDSLSEARQALKFGDINGALFYFDKAYRLHPRNREVMKELDGVLDRILGNMNEGAAAEQQRAYLSQIRELLKYESLSQNPRLIDKKKALEQSLEG